MFGVIVNTITVLIGSSIGLLLKKGIPQHISQAVMIAIGLCTIYIGIDGALEGNNTIVLIISMVAGTIVGTLLNIDGRIQRLGNYIEIKIKKNNEGPSVAEGFMTGCLLFCVGAMTIVGSINAGLAGDNKLLLTKSILDLISSCMLASTLGIGVMFSAIFVFAFQGSLVVLAGMLQGILTNTAIIAEITCAGSIMIMALGFNLVGLSKFKVADFLPAILIVPLVYWLIQFLPI